MSCLENMGEKRWNLTFEYRVLAVRLLMLHFGCGSSLSDAIHKTPHYVWLSPEAYDSVAYVERDLSTPATSEGLKFYPCNGEEDSLFCDWQHPKREVNYCPISMAFLHHQSRSQLLYCWVIWIAQGWLLYLSF